jgi:hypothetical protein
MNPPYLSHLIQQVTFRKEFLCTASAGADAKHADATMNEFDDLNPLRNTTGHHNRPVNSARLSPREGRQRQLGLDPCIDLLMRPVLDGVGLACATISRGARANVADEYDGAGSITGRRAAQDLALLFGLRGFAPIRQREIVEGPRPGGACAAN